MIFLLKGLLKSKAIDSDPDGRIEPFNLEKSKLQRPGKSKLFAPFGMHGSYRRSGPVKTKFFLVPEEPE